MTTIYYGRWGVRILPYVITMSHLYSGQVYTFSFDSRIARILFERTCERRPQEQQILHLSKKAPASLIVMKRNESVSV